MKLTCSSNYPSTFFVGGLLLSMMATVACAAGITGDFESESSTPESIPWSEIGARAGAEYTGESLSISSTDQGALLRCGFQRLEGEATPEGLWLNSTVADARNDRFRVVASSVGRVHSAGEAIAATGTVSVDGDRVRFVRPGLVEEYMVSVDGVRQDFVVLERLAGDGELRLQLAVTGARVEEAPFGARLVLANSKRQVAYSRLHVVDATGRELPARMEVAGDKTGSSRSDTQGEELAILVADFDAVYPIRIDPTFSDANWISMGGHSGVNGFVEAAVVDDSGNLYIGGLFELAGKSIANGIAKWDGSEWSALGSGMNSWVNALAVSGGDLYAGGSFTTAGGVSVNRIAKWDGNEWSALGSGMNGGVRALAVSGGDLYAGGNFTMAGGSPANRIAKWDGNEWSALGSGMNGGVSALAVSDGDLYAGGDFTTAGGVSVNHIAKWNGNAWSTLGSGVNNSARALAVSGGDLYAGGSFTMAGGSPANRIAKWDGNEWSALGSGVDSLVSALAVSGDDLYAGGNFNLAGGVSTNGIAKWNGTEWSALGSGVNGWVRALAISGGDLYAGVADQGRGPIVTKHIVKWDGSEWSALGSGMNSRVEALAVSDSALYVGGWFTTAGDGSANYIAKWNGSEWSALGSGMNSWVHALTVSGGDLYAGGSFRMAGGEVSAFFAKYAFTLHGIQRLFGGDRMLVRMVAPPEETFWVEATSDLTKTWSILGAATEVAPGVYEFIDSEALELPQRFYRRAVDE